VCEPSGGGRPLQHQQVQTAAAVAGNCALGPLAVELGLRDVKHWGNEGCHSPSFVPKRERTVSSGGRDGADQRPLPVRDPSLKGGNPRGLSARRLGGRRRRRLST